MKRGWIACGWLSAMIASALPVLWLVAERIEQNPLGKYVDPLSGAWTPVVYSRFFLWWLPVAIPVSLLALACLFLNRPGDRG